jgi:hypothetical protein
MFGLDSAELRAECTVTEWRPVAYGIYLMEEDVRPAWIRMAALALGLGLVMSSCTSWRKVSSNEDWALYVKPGGDVDVSSFEAMLNPAVEAVEQALGPFKRSVRIHAWEGGVELSSGNRGRITEGEDAGLIDNLPEMGDARVRAFHVRSGGLGPGGVFLGEAAPGAAVHELVHARFAELFGPRETLPLWFEEGIAQLIADGILVPDGSGGGQVWVRDGLCAWPLSMLRKQEITDAELLDLLAIRVSDSHSVEDNLMVHFVGWALVFDLYREDPTGSWRNWLARMEANPEDARMRLNRSIDEEGVRQWLKTRFDDENPAVRQAAARGVWRIGDALSLQLLSSALRKEQDMAVVATLTINILAAAGEGRFAGMGRWNGLRLPLMKLREEPFEDATERWASRRLLAGYQGYAGSEAIREAFEILSSYWQE